MRIRQNIITLKDQSFKVAINWPVGTWPVVLFCFGVLRSFFSGDSTLEQYCYSVLLASIWYGQILLSLLAHELGHSLMARAFGVSTLHIGVCAVFGATLFPVEEHQKKLTPGKLILVLLAGPVMSILVWLTMEPGFLSWGYGIILSLELIPYPGNSQTGALPSDSYQVLSSIRKMFR